MPSDIQITVRFQDQCVFAGEEVKCTITFKNVANASEPPTPGPPQRRKSRTLSIEKLAAQSPRFSDVLQSPRVGKANNYPPSAMKKALGGGSNEAGGGANQRPGHKHQRSVSIISMGSPTIGSSQDEGRNGKSGAPKLAHRRSSTIQVHTGHDRRPSQGGLPSGLQIPGAGGRRSPLSSSSASTPVYESRRSTPDFQFPPPAQRDAVVRGASRDASREPGSRLSSSGRPTHNRRDQSVGSRVTSERSSGEFYSLSNHSGETLMSEQPSVMSERPQIQIPSAMMRRHYRMDSVPPTPRRPQPQPVNLMMGYAHLSATFTVDGSLVDQSPFEEVKQKGFLGGQAGGGVVGVAQKKPRPTSGFLGGFNFNSIGESLNSLVGGDSMSSVREMNAVSNSRAIPLLSTPQSLLFVNLHLDSGEEKSYSFTCPLPRGLPSSYRGKAIKISYNLLIGVQSAGAANSTNPRVKQVSIPIRVFSGVDSDGEILGHDLMQPHVLLRDPARTASISGPLPDPDSPTNTSTPTTHTAQQAQYPTPDALRSYITTLLSRPTRRRHSSTPSLYDPGPPTLTAAEQAHPTLALINRAILSSSQRLLQPPSGQPGGGNRFNITHATHPLATLTLARPLLKLGETLYLTIHLAAPHTTPIRTVSVNCSLETTEKVSPELAVRSEGSVTRVSRRVWASWSAGGGGGPGGCLNGRRVSWGVSVPGREGVAPGLVTSGVVMGWGVRVEFGVLKRQGEGAGADEGVGGDGGGRGEFEARDEDDDGEDDWDDDPGEHENLTTQPTQRHQPSTATNPRKKKKPPPPTALTHPPIFEDVVTDERGIVSIAVEKLECESFEVVIPLTVYGDVLPLLAVGENGRREEVKVISV